MNFENWPFILCLDFWVKYSNNRHHYGLRKKKQITCYTIFMWNVWVRVGKNGLNWIYARQCFKRDLFMIFLRCILIHNYSFGELSIAASHIYLRPIWFGRWQGWNIPHQRYAFGWRPSATWIKKNVVTTNIVNLWAPPRSAGPKTGHGSPRSEILATPLVWIHVTMNAISLMSYAWSKRCSQPM